MGLSTAKRVPMRQCVGCGEMKPKKELIRVLRTDDGQITLDASGRKNGRGAYLCRNPECLKQAERRKGLERSFQMSIPKEIYESLGKELTQIDQT